MLRDRERKVPARSSRHPNDSVLRSSTSLQAAGRTSREFKERSMRAVVFHGVGDIRVDNVPDPKIKSANDAIVRLTASAICGTDLHMIRGTVTGMEPGTIMGHEGVGIVEQVGPDVRKFSP